MTPIAHLSTKAGLQLPGLSISCSIVWVRADRYFFRKAEFQVALAKFLRRTVSG
jgi:hypothetical protein